MSDEAVLYNLLEELAKVRRLDFRGYKPASLRRRLDKRLTQLNLSSYDDYLGYFHSNPEEINKLLEVVLINVTQFFRDAQAWDVFRQEALPLLVRGLRPGNTLRAWCAGCATGQEVYSLAMLLAEHFGPNLSEYDIKLYATDHDEDALNIARRGEYSVDEARRVPPDLRARYLAGNGSTVRVHRDLRRMCIFGRGNLVNDAPISHVQLLVCRNVLIYFDVPLQRRVLDKFRYALDGGGILFLGRSESQLLGLSYFHPINAKWRIFRCGKSAPAALEAGSPSGNLLQGRELESVLHMQQQLLETFRSGIVILDNAGVVKVANDSAISMWGARSVKMVGFPIAKTPLARRCPQVLNWIEQSQSAGNTDVLRFDCAIDVDGDDRRLDVMLRPLLESDGTRSGTLIYSEDATPQERLRSTVEELETTAEELHSANEELETTNEELQSTNEELETTNEELQATNEELETTNEELHSLNEELETTNDELEQRTRQLEEMTARYAETLALLPSPIMVVNDASEILLWNAASEKLFGITSKGIVGLKLHQVPIAARVKDAMARRHQSVVLTQEPSTVRGLPLKAGSFSGRVDLRLTPIPGSAGRGVLIMIDAHRLSRPAKSAKPKSSSQAAKKKALAKKRTTRKKH